MIEYMADKTFTGRRLLFLTVNSSFSHSSLALPLLHNACRDLTQWEWLRYDMTINEDVMSALERIHALGCDLLVSDLYLFNRRTALEVLQRFHTLDPRCRIAVGGPECLGEGAERLLEEYPWLDCVFRGEGETVFREYLENFDSTPAGRIMPSDGNAVYQAWENAPCPVTSPFFETGKPFVQMETSRGCPMGCYYCTSGSSSTRYRSLEQVRGELTLLRERGVKELRILDRTFNLPQDRGAALLRMFREEFSDMRFHLELHPQFLNEDLRRELLAALPGQLHIEVGIQCLDQEVQQLSGRRSSVEAALEGLTFLCTLSAFETHADLLAGLPGQKWEHILKDTAALMKIGTAEIQLEVLKVLPGTPLVRIAPRYGIRYAPASPYDVMQSSSMSLEEIRRARDLSRLLDLTYNHKNLHRAAAVMNRECPDFVCRLLEFFLRSGGDASAVWDLKKRFLFLHNFAREHHLKEGERELARQWLRAGFPPEQGADTCSKKLAALPPDAVLETGDGSCAAARETRYWLIPGEEEGKDRIFAFNRAYALNRPAAVWTCLTD